MAYNKVIYGGNTLIDLTEDTVTPETMILGATAHAANGETITGVVELANAGTNAPLVDSGSGSVGSATAYAREDHVHPMITNGDLGQGYGTCQTAASVSEKAVNLIGYKRVTGAIFSVKFSYSAPGNATLNVNSTGAVPVYYLGSALPAGVIEGGDFVTFVFSGAYYHIICFDKDKPKRIGQGFFNCSTAYDTDEKTIVAPGFQLTTGGIVTVYFDNDVGANATLNINSTGAKPIYYRDKSITSGIIKYGDFVTFVYDGNYYILLAIDRTIETIGNIELIADYIGADELETTAQTLGGAINEVNTKATGQGYAYGTCSTAAGTAAKVVNASGYKLVTGGTVTVFFFYDVPANATLNVNNTGAKSIQHKTAGGIGVISADVIKSGDIATFVYTGSAYMLVGLGSRLYDRAPLDSPALTGTPTAPTAAAGTDTTQIATTAFVQQEIADSAISLSSKNPVMDGTASAGTGTAVAREDHVHPSDTSRVAKSGDTMSGNLTFEPSANIIRKNSGSTALQTPAFTVTESLNGFTGSLTYIIFAIILILLAIALVLYGLKVIIAKLTLFIGVLGLGIAGPLMITSKPSLVKAGQAIFWSIIMSGTWNTSPKAIIVLRTMESCQNMVGK